MFAESMTQSPRVEDHHSTLLQPRTILLKDGETTATMYPIPASPGLLPAGLLAFLLDEFNMEIEKGDSFPYYEPLSLEEFKRVWFDERNGVVCVMVLGEIPELDYSVENGSNGREASLRRTPQYVKRKERRNMNLNIQWEKQCLGSFNLKPAYPGRSSHVVTGTFLVNAGIRGKGIGHTLVECFLDWAPRLGFTSSCFPLVYGTNVGIRRILETLNFRRVGKLPESGILKGCDSPVDSFIYGKEFTHVSKTIDMLNGMTPDGTIAKYERLRHYLETGQYPPMCDRNEKARLRASAKTHSLINGKIMTKGREVVYNTQRQLEIAFEVHSVNHHGINKVTTKIAERYHWQGIKQTVAQIVGSCPRCKENHPDAAGIVVVPSPQQQAHMLVHQHGVEDHSSQLSRVAAAVVGSLRNGARGEPTPVDTGPGAGSVSVAGTSSAEEPVAGSGHGRKRLASDGINDDVGVASAATATATSTPATTATATATLHRLKFGHDGQGHVSSQPILSNEQSMNSFTRYARENARKKPRYLDIAAGGSPSAALTAGTRVSVAPAYTSLSQLVRGTVQRGSASTTPGSHHDGSEPGTVEIIERDDTNIDDALLDLEDNVIAAVEAVQKEQERKRRGGERGGHGDGGGGGGGGDGGDGGNYRESQSEYF